MEDRSSSSRLMLISASLALIGLLDSLYLTWYKIAGTAPLCEGFGDCSTVNSSRFADIGGIPIALLGVGAYLLILAIHSAEWRRMLHPESANLAVFGLALVGTLYSAYLTYIELYVLRAVCPFCVISAVVMTGVFAVSITRLARGGQTELDALQES